MRTLLDQEARLRPHLLQALVPAITQRHTHLPAQPLARTGLRRSLTALVMGPAHDGLRSPPLTAPGLADP